MHSVGRWTLLSASVYSLCPRLIHGASFHQPTIEPLKYGIWRVERDCVHWEIIRMELHVCSSMMRELYPGLMIKLSKYGTSLFVEKFKWDSWNCVFEFQRDNYYEEKTHLLWALSNSDSEVPSITDTFLIENCLNKWWCINIHFINVLSVFHLFIPCHNGIIAYLGLFWIKNIFVFLVVVFN